MGRKNSSKKKRNLDQMLIGDEEEAEEETTTTQASNLSLLMGNSDVNQNIDALISNGNQSNSSNNDTNILARTSSMSQDLVNVRNKSRVWNYATKSKNGQQASCLLCNFVCSSHSHSTSTIRQHLISKHDKKDLITPPSDSDKPNIPEAFKKELHQLCYYAIIKDSRPFNDLNKTGIKALLNKLYPGYSPPHRNQVSQQMELLYNHHYNLLKDELCQVQGLSITFDFWSNRQMQSFLCITGQWYTDKIDPVSKIIDFSVFNYHHTGLDIARVVKEKLVALDVFEKIVCITCDGAPNMIVACNYLNDEIPRIWCAAHRLHLVVINSLGFWLTEDNIKDYNNNLLVGHAATTTSAVTTTTLAASVAATTTSAGVSLAATTTSALASLAATTTIPTFISTFDDDEAMDFNWNEECTEDSWVVNKSNFNDELTTNIYGQRNDENSPIYDEDTPNDEDDVEIIYDNWLFDFDIDVNPPKEKLLINAVLKKCRAISNAIKQSSILAEYLRKEQKSSNSDKTIRIDCKTRWNSTQILITSFIALKHSIIKLFSDKKSFKLRSDQTQKLTTIELNVEDWDLLTSLNTLLNPFLIATTMMSGKYYPTIGLCYYAINKIKSFCTKTDTSDEQIKKMKGMLYEKLKKYFHDDPEQLKTLQRFAYFDPCSHSCLTDREKYQIEVYIKGLVNNDTYPMNLTISTVSSTSSSAATTTSPSTTVVVDARAETHNSTAIPPKLTTFQRFMLACGEESPTLLNNTKQKSQRILINEELKVFKVAVAEFNLVIEPSVTSAITFWKRNKDRLPILTNLARIHLSACGTSVPSESAFSISAYTARKERARLSGKNLAYTVFLKDKVLTNN